MEVRLFNELYSDSFFISGHLDKTSDPVEKSIFSFADLEEGWNYGEGSPPSQDTISRAIKVYKIGKEYALDTEVFPVSEGEIELSFSLLDHFVDILIKRDGTYNLYYEIGVGEKYEEREPVRNAAITEIKERLRELAGLDECISLELCESSHTTGERSDLYHEVFEITKDLYPLWTVYAS